MTPAPADDSGSVRRQLRELGLTADQTKVLLALLHTEAANSIQLAAASGVARTSIYRIMGDLTERHLATRLPNPGPAAWTAPGWETVLDTLAAAAHEHHRQHQARIRRLRHTVATTHPTTPPLVTNRAR